MRYLVWGTGKRAEEVCSLYNDKFKQVNGSSMDVKAY